jgi:SNF2 family DNA or RNA helicase
MTEPQRTAYEQMAEEMFAETESGELLIAANPAVKMLRMVQFSSATVDMVNMSAQYPEGIDRRIVEEAEAIDPELIARLVDPSNKLDALMDDLPDLINAGEQIVVFAVSRQLIEMAEERLKKAKIKFSVIKGNQKQAFRQEQIDRFQNGQVPVILVVIAAGGVGITLTAARIGIFLQRSWSFIDNHQAEGRLHRIGSEIHSSIEYIDYISEETVDEVVVEVAEGKELRLEEIVRDRDTVRRLLHGKLSESITGSVEEGPND